MRGKKVRKNTHRTDDQCFKIHRERDNKMVTHISRHNIIEPFFTKEEKDINLSMPKNILNSLFL